MLGEIRRRYAAGPVADALALIERTLKLQEGCPEALFWQAMCLLREGQPDKARAVLASIPEQPFLDPPYYLGMLMLRAGEATEAVRRLSTAHRLDPNCPFLNWQLGRAMVEAGSDPCWRCEPCSGP